MRTTKNIITLVALLMLMSAIVPAKAQEQRGGLSFKRLFLDYQTLNDGDFGAFRDYTDGLEFSYLYRLTDRLTLDVPVKIGLSNNAEVRNNNLIGLDIHANYYLRDQEKIFRPYVLAGVGGVMENQDSFNLQIPLGAGLDLMLVPRAYVTWQSEVRLSTDENKHNFNHSVGFKYLFGGGEVVEEPPLDTDEDGIVDTVDMCPLVPGLAAFMGCPDTDNDGVADKDDICPEYPGLPEFGGCPDSDNDGVPDNEDECPEEAGVVENNGCPYADRDADGVYDAEDRCPDLAGPPELNGCPDSDGDGLVDPDDDCPGRAGLVRFGGCPDTDADGVRDPDDACPTTAGPAENQGCPVIEAEDKETLDFAMRAVRFEHGSARLRSDSYEVLDQVVDILRRYREYSLEIRGHTDSTGAESFNQKLSEERAEACFHYIVEKGISARRLTYVGFGESRPVADNDTQTGRQLNRRVEFEMIPGIED